MTSIYYGPYVSWESFDDFQSCRIAATWTIETQYWCSHCFIIFAFKFFENLLKQFLIANCNAFTNFYRA